MMKLKLPNGETAYWTQDRVYYVILFAGEFHIFADGEGAPIGALDSFKSEKEAIDMVEWLATMGEEK